MTAADSSSAGPSSPANAAADELPDGEAGRILVAEDEENLGMLLVKFLRGRGFDVTQVQDGTAAVSRLAEGGFDAAVVDVQMPGADGYAVLAAARAQPRPPEVVIVTGNGTRDTAIAALRGGAYGTVAKPYRMAEVELVVARAVETRRLRDTVDALRRECDELRRAQAAQAGDDAAGAPDSGRARP